MPLQYIDHGVGSFWFEDECVKPWAGILLAGGYFFRQDKKGSKEVEGNGGIQGILTDADASFSEK